MSELESAVAYDALQISQVPAMALTASAKQIEVSDKDSQLREVAMKIEEILHSKGHDVVTITESQSVLDAVELLVARNIGGLVVMEGQRPAGIFTERDILRLTARAPGELAAIKVGSVMTREVITAGPQDDLATVMDVMTENKIRHLPVMTGDQLTGIVSIGDLLNACRVSVEAENSELRQYIQGVG